MTSREQLERIKRAVKKYTKKLGLEECTIDCHLVVETSINKEWYDAYVTSKDFKCKEYDINFSKNALNNLDSIVLHELLHILLWGMSDVVETAIKIGDIPPENVLKLDSRLEMQEHEIIDKLIIAIRGKL